MPGIEFNIPGPSDKGWVARQREILNFSPRRWKGEPKPLRR